jgi:hypothetical protein
LLPTGTREKTQANNHQSAELKRFDLLEAALLVVWLWSLLHAQGFVHHVNTDR